MCVCDVGGWVWVGVCVYAIFFHYIVSQLANPLQLQVLWVWPLWECNYK